MTAIALGQMRMSEDVEANLDTSLRCMDEAAAAGAKLIVFPEVQLTPFFPQYRLAPPERYCMTLDDPAVEALRAKCRETGMVAVPNLYLQLDGGRYDASPVIDADGSILGVSKMVHIVDMRHYREQDHYRPSDDGFKVYDTAIGKLGVVICYDRHFPESFRACALQGAEIVATPTANIHGEALETFEWEMRIAALHNGVFTAMCNRVGREDEMDFCGESLIADPSGDLVTRAGGEATVATSDIDLSAARRSRARTEFLALRRPETYGT